MRVTAIGVIAVVALSLFATSADAARGQAWITLRNAALTPAERANPPVTDAEAKAVYDRGVVSGQAGHCRLDWKKRNFDPMIAWWRNVMHKNARQIAIMTSIHNQVQTMGQSAMDASSPCDAALKAKMNGMLDFHPPAR